MAAPASAGNLAGPGETVHAQIEVWEPGARLVFGSRSRNYQEGERTQVEVLFDRAGDGTRVTVEHGGSDALRPGHPARDGFEGPAFTAMMGTWWADPLNAMRPGAPDST